MLETIITAAAWAILLFSTAILLWLLIAAVKAIVTRSDQIREGWVVVGLFVATGVAVWAVVRVLT